VNWRIDRHFALHVWYALQRVAGLLLLVAAHFVSGWALDRVVPPEWTLVRKGSHAAVAVTFLTIYFVQLVELVGVFIPRLRNLRDRLFGSDT
jgi:hypothetical protein